MAKLSNYIGTVELASGVKPKNNRTFPLMEAHDIVVSEDDTRLDSVLNAIADLWDVVVGNYPELTQAMVSCKTGSDVIVGENDEGTVVHRYEGEGSVRLPKGMQKPTISVLSGSYASITSYNSSTGLCHYKIYSPFALTKVTARISFSCTLAQYSAWKNSVI